MCYVLSFFLSLELSFEILLFFYFLKTCLFLFKEEITESLFYCFRDYNYLRTHFRKDHYLCEEGDCVNEQFTGAFRTEIDLKAHTAIHHSKNKSKAEARQARTLELEFNFAPHSRSNGKSIIIHAVSVLC